MASLTDTSYSFYEPMRKNWFIVQFDGFDDNGDPLTIACKTCTIPTLTTAENPLHRINDIVYTPGKSEYNAIEFSFYEFIKENVNNTDNSGVTMSAGEFLYNWQQSIHNAKTGVQGAKKSIAHNAAIVQINGEGQPVRVWNIYKCWPTSVEFASLDSADGSAQEVSCTVRYDWAESSNPTIETGAEGTESTTEQTAG